MNHNITDKFSYQPHAEIWIDLIHVPANRAFVGFCRNRIFGIGLCNSNRCVCNVTAIKVISVLYALIVRLRASNIEITMEDLMPVEILQRFWTEYLEPNGFGGVRTLIENFPQGKRE